MSEIKEYACSAKNQLTEHFNVSEFRCKCGGNHNTKLNTRLVTNLEELYKRLNCSKIIVNSGYRCSAHDASPYVGGSGRGQHVNGNAADIVCYDKKGNRINSKIVACIAQDIGFSGIANIDRSYTATHVDVREGSKWLGDEVVTTSYSVTTNFRTYYGITDKMISDITGKPVTTTAKPESTATTTNTSATAATEAARGFDKSLAGKYKVSATALNIRSGAGTTKPIMVTIPTGFSVNCYGYYTDVAGVKWLYIKFDYKGKTYTGFASSDWLIKS